MHRILGHDKSLIICENQFFLNDFINFLKDKKIDNYFVLNDLEVLPYDIFSPHQEKLSLVLKQWQKLQVKIKLLFLRP